MKLPVPVFDSSQIDIPNPPPIKFSSFEGQPLTAWRPSGQRGNSLQRSTPNGELLGSKVNGFGTPRDKPADITLEGRGSPQVQHKRSSSSSKKWAEPSLDKRSKTILDVLQSKRASKQSDSRHADTPEVTKRNDSVLSSVNGEITKDKVIKYPKFVVKEKRKSGQGEHNHSKKEAENRMLTRSQSLRSKRNPEYIYSGESDPMADRKDVYREVDPRRSFRQYRGRREYMHEQTGIPAYSPKQRQSYAARDKPSNDYPTDQSVDDYIMGFFPDEMQDCFQAKPLNAGRSDSPSANKSRIQSPPYEHVPPPPTPASQLLMQLGVDPNDNDTIEEELRYEMRLQQERRKSMREKSRNRDKSSPNKRDRSDPGVSHTTQQLLESNIIKRNFIFPNLSPDALRKSLTTPRNEEKGYMYRMSPSPFGRSKTLLNSGTLPNAQFGAAPVQSYDVNDGIGETREKSASKIDLSQSHDQLATQEAQRSHSSFGMSNGLARSHSFYQGQKKTDKYARMISLGLPKVNIDIDKNHFSQGNVLRRSVDIREKYQIPDHIRDVKIGEQDNSKYLKKYAPTQDYAAENDDRKSSSSHKTPQRNESRSGENSDAARLTLNEDMLVDVDDSERGPECSSHIKFIPPPNTPIGVEANVFQRRSTVRKKSSKIPVKTKSGTKEETKGAVGVSYFKMANPGEKTERDGTKLTDKPSDVQKFVYGVSS